MNSLKLGLLSKALFTICIFYSTATHAGLLRKLYTLHTNWLEYNAERRKEFWDDVSGKTPVVNPADLTKNTAPYTFKDLAGDIPEDVLEIPPFIANSENFERVGAKMPKGILLYGPPGTGKTSIARAIAGEASAAFFPASGSQFIELYVGQGPQRIRELFNQARAAVDSGIYPKAIIFIDEIDAIGGKREFENNSEYRNTLEALLHEMDGFAQDNRIFVIGATNMLSNLDPALRRPGRFDRLVEIGLPNKQNRVAILRLYAQKIAYQGAGDVFDHIANKTEGWSPAELSYLINEAAVFAAREHASAVDDDHIERAYRKALRRHLKN